MAIANTIKTNANTPKQGQ